MFSKKHKNVCTTLNHIEHFLILASIIAGCISLSSFASLVGIPIGITSSAIGFKICAITTEIKKYIIKKNIIKPIIKKKKKKHHKMILLAKSKLNSIKVLISRDLIYSVTVMMNLC